MEDYPASCVGDLYLCLFFEVENSEGLTVPDDIYKFSYENTVNGYCYLHCLQGGWVYCSYSEENVVGVGVCYLTLD